MSTDPVLLAAPQITDAVIAALTNERGVHAETAVIVTARLAGTCLFRTFHLPVEGLEPGAVVLSEIANERGPGLVATLQAGLESLQVDPGSAPEGANLTPAEPHLGLLETQRLLQDKVTGIGRAAGLDDARLADACALATALMIKRASRALAPRAAVEIAVQGFVEATKTVPAR